MKYKILSLLIISIFLVSCGVAPVLKRSLSFIQKEVDTQQLDLTVEASGTVEAISSIEIKSKASGEILYLGAEIGDYIEKGQVLARIDQRTPKNNLEQASADLDVAKVRLQNAESQFLDQKHSTKREAFLIKLLKMLKNLFLQQNLNT